MLASSSAALFISAASRWGRDQGAHIIIARKGQWQDRLTLAELGPALLPLLLLITAFACGGGSALQPFRDIIVQMVAIVVLAAAAAGFIGRGFSPDARIPLILIGLLALLMLFQLTPLPHSLWASLGGRDVGAGVLDLIGQSSGMRPLSVQPESTVMSALSLLPGVAMAVAVLRLGTSARLALAWGVVPLALISLLLGAVQVSLGSQAQSLTFYTTTHLGLPLGVFANANHQADLLVIAIVITGVLSSSFSGEGARMRRWIAWGVMAFLAAGVVATGSRAGIAVMGIGLIAVVLRERLSGHIRLFLLGLVGLTAALAALIAFNPVFSRSFADFANVDDPRFHFWPNVLYAIGHFGWLGTGAGTFDGVYRSVETLDTLSSRFLNHAHNDYLEIVLEMGVPGALLLLAFIAFIVWRGVGIVRRTELRPGLSLAYAAMVCAGLLLLHSAVDYPLRTPLLGVVFGLCCALMTRPPREREEDVITPLGNPV